MSILIIMCYCVSPINPLTILFVAGDFDIFTPDLCICCVHQPRCDNYPLLLSFLKFLLPMLLSLGSKSRLRSPSKRLVHSHSASGTSYIPHTSCITHDMNAHQLHHSCTRSWLRAYAIMMPSLIDDMVGFRGNMFLSCRRWQG